MTSLYAADYCEEGFPVSGEISNLTNPNYFQFSSKYYLYYESNNLEDLQVLKNCLDYSVCGKNQESIVADPFNYRMHIWTKLTLLELENLIRTCPIPNISSKLVVKENGQSGKPVSLTHIKPSAIDQQKLMKNSSPAFFQRHSDKFSKDSMKKLGELLKANKTKEAEALVISVWGINLHDYKIEYGKVGDTFATTSHKDKMIRYGKSWLESPCDFARMIRHEAEHVAQVKRSAACGGKHNYSDHSMRERAAHLNDARFAEAVCPESTVKEFCLNRFKTHYLKTQK